MSKRSQKKELKPKIAVVDLFCGVGGLTRGLLDEGLNVVAGIDVDGDCEFPYKTNNGAEFLKKDVEKLKAGDLAKLYPKGQYRVLVGCAPCQPFSKYTQGQNTEEDSKWFLLRSFARLVQKTRPDAFR